MSQPSPCFTLGSLYLAGFAQARAPHASLIIPSSASSGLLVHVRVDRTTFSVWTFQSRVQKIEGDMFLSTLLKLRDVAAGPITIQQLQTAAASVPAPPNDDFGEFLPWVLRVVQELHQNGLLVFTDCDGLRKEFETFASGNVSFATRTKSPNVKESEFCS